MLTDMPITLVGGGPHAVDILEALTSIFPNATFGYFRPLPGEDFSIRIISSEPGIHLVPTKPMRAPDVAMELMRLGAKEARYGERPSPTSQKGWRIAKTEYGGKPAILALATWF